jgi:hypothetical protein
MIVPSTVFSYEVFLELPSLHAHANQLAELETARSRRALHLLTKNQGHVASGFLQELFARDAEGVWLRHPAFVAFSKRFAK